MVPKRTIQNAFCSMIAHFYQLLFHFLFRDCSFVSIVNCANCSVVNQCYTRHFTFLITFPSFEIDLFFLDSLYNEKKKNKNLFRVRFSLASSCTVTTGLCVPKTTLVSKNCLSVSHYIYTAYIIHCTIFCISPFDYTQLIHWFELKLLVHYFIIWTLEE